MDFDKASADGMGHVVGSLSAKLCLNWCGVEEEQRSEILTELPSSHFGDEKGSFSAFLRM
jgi:hypothetical protein